MVKVMIADDETVFREAMKKCFPWEKHGCQVCGEARNGEEALDQIRNLKPDIVLVDINMPFLGGLEFIEKAGRLMMNPIFIIVSGYSEFCYAKEAIRLGVMGYLLKPVQEEELADILHAAVDKIRLSREKKEAGESLTAMSARQRLTADCKAELLISVQQADWKGTAKRLEEIYRKTTDVSENAEKYFPVSIEIVEVILDISKKQRIALYGGHGDLESAKQLLYCMQETSQIKKYVFEVGMYCIYQMAQNRFSDAVACVLKYISRHYREPDLTVNKIATETFLNYHYLCSQFKKETFMTVNTYLIGYRMHQALLYLGRGNRSPEQAAVQCGYTDTKYFAKCFKKQFGVTPRQLRK